MELITRQQARAQGKTRYYTGKLCRNNHVAQRKTDNGCCCQCISINSKKCLDHLRATDPARVYLYGAKHRAKKLGLQYDLDLDWFNSRWTGKCELTGIEFIKPNHGGTSVYGFSIDRIDNSKGYIKTNCRFILCGINMLKNTGTDEDVEKIARALVEHFDE